MNTIVCTHLYEISSLKSNSFGATRTVRFLQRSIGYGHDVCTSATGPLVLEDVPFLVF
jgi:hypothetical protein